MTEQQEQRVLPLEGAAPEAAPVAETNGQAHAEQGETTPAAEAANGTAAETRGRHAEAGRKGALRRHQLIQEGRLYEQEHGLKSGRQRIRQLIELGKLYEQEHGLRPGLRKKRGRLSRVRRDELLATLLQCLVRIARPSFRAQLLRLAEALADEAGGHAA
jgi:hypothetical protein